MGRYGSCWSSPLIFGERRAVKFTNQIGGYGFAVTRSLLGSFGGLARKISPKAKRILDQEYAF